MVIQGNSEDAIPGSIDSEVWASSRTLRIGSLVATSTRIHKSARYHVGPRDRIRSPAYFVRLRAERYWSVGRVVLQLGAAAAMITQKESVALAISGIAMMAEIAQDRSTRNR